MIIRRKRWVIWGLVLGLLLVALPEQVVRGATIVVTNNADSGANTLRQAIADANNGDVIEVSSALVGDITLTSGELGISKQLIILLNEKRIDGGGNSRIFNVAVGGSLTLKNGTIINGSAAGAGGAIYADGTLTLEKMTVSGSTATGNGGGIFSRNDITLQQVVMDGNQSGGNGGAVYMEAGSSKRIQYSEIKNSTLTGAAGNGAGVYVSGNATIIDTTISGNTGAVFGGGIYSTGATNLAIDLQTSITGNEAINTGGAEAGGGGLYVAAGSTANVRRSSITGNISYRGGGIYSAGRVNAANVTLDTNQANNLGGAFTDNGGGGVYTGGSGVFVGSFLTISENTPNAVRSDTGATLVLRTSVLVTAGDTNCAGTITDGGYNLESGATCAFNAPSISGTDANLQALTNGYRPILNSSAAYNAATVCTIASQSTDVVYTANSIPVDDQRNVSRPQDNVCDIGAFELEDAPNLTPGFSVNLLGTDTVEEKGSTTILYTITLNSLPTSTVEFDITTPDGEVTVDLSTITFDTDNWSIPQTIAISAIDDATEEDDPHEARVITAIDSGATADSNYSGLVSQTITVKVDDDDSGRTFTIDDVSILEGDADTTTVLNFPIRLSNAAPNTINVTYETANGTALDSDNDYVPTSGVIPILAGELEALIPVTVNGDNVGESNEIFTVQIINVSAGAEVARNFGIGTIENDDEITLDIQLVVPTSFDETFEATVSASGGVPPYGFSVSGLPDEDDWNFDADTLKITSKPTRDYDFTVSIRVVDANNATITEEFKITIDAEEGTASVESVTDDEDGSGTGETTEPTAVPTPNEQEIEATRVANLRTVIGEPRATLSDSRDIEGLSIRTGPMIGASLVQVAIRGVEYPIIGVHRVAGQTCLWYLIEYPTGIEPAPAVDVDGDGIADEVTNDLSVAEGWVNGCYIDIQGFTPDIVDLGNPFDNVNLSNTGITGVSALKNNLYRYPTPISALVGTFDENESFQILGRTVIDRRNFTYWILVRMDRTGMVGWTRWTPFVTINGDIGAVPLY